MQVNCNDDMTQGLVEQSTMKSDFENMTEVSVAQSDSAIYSAI